MGTDYTKYYTPAKISTTLISLLKLKNNSKIADICCGSGNLLSAAYDVDSSLECVGVDVNPVQTGKHSTILDDGRAYAVKYKEVYDFAVANPPFGKSGSDSYSEMLFTDIYSDITSSRMEVEMLIANLMILKKEGTLLIILPATFVDGYKLGNTRRIIAKNHTIHTIIDLPTNAFSPKRIRCSALIIEKKENSSNTSTQHYIIKENMQLYKLQDISFDAIKSSSWVGNFPMRCSSFHIKQGGVSSNCFADAAETEILHTSGKSSDWKPILKRSIIPTNRKCVIAEKGDIIISRIGASAGQKCVYSGEPKYISDCLFVIKSPPSEVRKRIYALDLTMLVKGLSTPFISAYSIYRKYNEDYPSHVQ